MRATWSVHASAPALCPAPRWLCLSGVLTWWLGLVEALVGGQSDGWLRDKLGGIDTAIVVRAGRRTRACIPSAVVPLLQIASC